MHIDGRNVADDTTLTSDICIIGAGAAGITIARRLAHTSIDVCVLESGGLDTSGEAQGLYDGKNVGLPYFALDSCRLRYFGGSTNHWAGWCSPLTPIDFQDRSWIPHSGWPISREDLDPYYPEAQQICQLGPYDYTPERWLRHFDDNTILSFDPEALPHHVIQFSPPTRFGDTYRTDVLDAENITVVTHANVTEIRTPPSAATVTDLKVQCLTGTSFQAQAQQYVLACGGIENPRLLLLSDRYAPNGLGNQNDLVGRFFMEHPRAAAATVVFTEREPLSPYRGPTFHETSRDFKIRYSASAQQQRSARTLNGFLNFDFRSSGYFNARTLMQDLRREKLQFGQDLDDLSEAVAHVMADFAGTVSGTNDALRGASPWNNGYRSLEVVTGTEQAPNPDSRVQLGDERDALGQRRGQLDWQLSDLDRHTIRQTTKTLARQLGATGTGRLRLHEWLRHEGAPWPDDLKGGWHHIGTTRMGDTPQEGVCDSQCKVYDVDNLYIAGSSVFPTAGGAPPTLTIVALSLRLADHLQTIVR